MTTSNRKSIHGEWHSRWTFILAATAAAVGLGNIWKFPYVAGQNGGSAFVLVYLIAIMIIGIPLMMAEIALGRNGRQNPANTMQTIALEAGRNTSWRWVGFMAMLSGFLILSYYSVIAGWTLDYLIKTISGEFVGIDSAQANTIFQHLLASPLVMLFWHSLIMICTVGTVALGLQKGIENAIRYIFPMMVILLLLLIGYSIHTHAFMLAVTFLFTPDFSQLTPHMILIALGQAFFSLSLAMGCIMMYGAYLPSRASVASAAVAIAAADTGIALLAGLAVFPIVFFNHLEPSSGPGLIFQTLPLAFGRMPYGTLFGTMFFLMLIFAAFTSTISLLEPTTAWIIENFRTSRWAAASIAGTIIWLLGFVTILSFNYWSQIKIFGLSIFSAIDYLTANIMLPLVGLMLAIFAVWRVNKDMMRDELQLKHKVLFNSWRFVMRYITPVAIIIVFLHVWGVL